MSARITDEGIHALVEAAHMSRVRSGLLVSRRDSEAAVKLGKFARALVKQFIGQVTDGQLPARGIPHSVS